MSLNNISTVFFILSDLKCQNFRILSYQDIWCGKETQTSSLTCCKVVTINPKAE